MAKIAIAAVLIVILVLVLRVCSSAMTINITVNGNSCTIHGAKTLQTAIKESGLPINPGDLISIRGVVLRKSEGEPFTATVNGETVTDPNWALHNGDELVVSDGKDVVEDYESTENITPHSASIDGAGAIRKITAGSDGVTEIRTGKVSGESIERLKSETKDAYVFKCNPEVGKDKVIALTFDGGPSDEYTEEILDILKENGAHATFFCIGNEIEKYRDALVQREQSEGHQVCTGAYGRTHKATSLSAAASDEDVADQLRRSREIIARTLGDDDAGKILRLPEDRLNEHMISLIDSDFSTEVGWNVDTGDWMESSADEVYKVLMTLEPGDIVLCHDGGGDHSGTVEALRRAIPELRDRGYAFVTIDDLLEYPIQ